MRNSFLNNTRNLLTAALIAAVGLTSCEKYLSPESSSVLTVETTYENVPMAKTALAGIYNTLSGDFGYGIRLSMYYPYDNDEMMGQTGNTVDGERRDISRYAANSSNTQLAPVYNKLYAGIERANIFIYNLPKTPLFQNSTGNQSLQVKRMLGEALTLRAQFYFELVRNWGDVPAQWQPSAFESDLYKSKTDRDSIYDHILADLLVAQDLVPWRTEISTIGEPTDQRITKGAVKALRARIALFRGGYSLRNDSHLMERRSDYKKYYQIAYDETKAIIDAGKHSLISSYRSLWKDYLCAHNTNDPNGEFMFVAAMGGATSATDSKLGIYNGTSFLGQGGGALRVLPNYFYLFDSLDVRRDVTAVPYRTIAGNVKEGLAITSITDGKFRKEWLTNPAYNSANTTQFLGLNWPIIRYSDVLLMFAEADNELNNGPSAAAIAAVNAVSLRGHDNVQANVLPIPTDYSGFFKYLVRERALEFGGEGIRKYDLIRWNLLSKAISETRANLTLLHTWNSASTATSMLTTPMVAPTYMAGPPSYALTNTLPRYMYYVSGTTNEGSNPYNRPSNPGIWASSLYKASTRSVTPINVGTGVNNGIRVNWIGPTSATNTSGIKTTFSDVFARGFVENKSELLPFANATLQANPNLTQNYGY
ncbi:RagB/SusD family nutrient uptake outer membrane protein [Desertivirga brevis]|uniref:RagB/SusD family nutrient uptake outer membrane protein n=1 Tax=Desertivirga brevis TaxID=2810310 RepID=UPI001F60A0C6|nr:RagB/SusD family nutrient uptake outer membrane protein [Pedobacter sp. SYSU D00873]